MPRKAEPVSLKKCNHQNPMPRVKYFYLVFSYTCLSKKKFRKLLSFFGSVLMVSCFFYYTVSCKEEEKFIPLKIFSIDPPEALIGDTITIIGEGFSPGFTYNNVFFTGSDVDVVPISGSTTEKLIVAVPDGAQSGPIRVDILDEETYNSPPLAIRAPVIGSITPDEAWAEDTVVITGQNFRIEKERNTVRFNGSSNAVVAKSTATELKVIVPVNARTGIVSVLGYAGLEFTVKPSGIIAITPEQGGTGDTISITGLGVDVSSGSLRAFFENEKNATILPGATSRLVRVVVPENATDGPITLRNIFDGQEQVLTSPQIFQVYPKIIEVSPLNGMAGTPVTIQGYSFRPDASENTVKFNGMSAVVTRASTRELQVTAPAGFSTGPVTVTVNGRVAEGPEFQLSQAGTPIIYNLAPRSGPVGSNVVINGINFSSTPSGNTVTFGGNTTASVLSATETQLVVKVPAGAQTGQVTVTKDGKTGIGGTFTVAGMATPFLASVSPPSALRGSNITLVGGNFSTHVQDITVRTESFDNFTVISSTGEQIVATVSGTVAFGDHTLYVEQGNKLSNGVHFVVAGTPALTSLSILEGAPGAEVTITGTQFNASENQNTVRFGTTASTIVNPADPFPNQITVYVPDVAPGTYDVTVTAFGNTSNALSFTVKPKPVAKKNVYYSSAALEGSVQHVYIKKITSDPPSETTIYRTSFGADGNISVLNLDLANGKVYFVRDNTGVIARCNFNNTGYEPVYETGSVVGDISLDVANNKLYWSDIAVGTVNKGSLDGTQTPDVLFDYSVLGIYTFGVSHVPNDNSLYLTDWTIDPSSDPVGILKATTDGSGTPATLYNGDDGLTDPWDVKIDPAQNKLFVINGLRQILAGNADGTGSLTTLFNRPNDIGGISLDVQDGFIYWIEYTDQASGTAAVFRAKYDGADIPGTDPPVKVEAVYSNISVDFSTTFGNSGGHLAVEESTQSGGMQRMRVSFAPLKFRSSKTR